MKLFYTPRSPYARIARIAIMESGLAERVAQIEVRNRDLQSPLLAYSPVGRVPTLVDGDLVVGEARNICGYFDAVTGEGRFFPEGLAADWHHRSLEAQIMGFLDGIAVWVRERRRPEEAQSTFLLEIERQRARRCLNYLEDRSPERSDTWHWDFSRIALASTLGIMDHSLPDFDWRRDHPKLAGWFDERAERPAMKGTVPPS